MTQALRLVADPDKIIAAVNRGRQALRVTGYLAASDETGARPLIGRGLDRGRAAGPLT